MGRLNGIGTTHLGIGPRDASGVAWTTVWLTILYLPVVPVRRERVQFLPHKGSGYSYRVLERGPRDAGSIARTLIFSWLAVPLVVLGPAALILAESWRALGLPESLHPWAIGAWILWLAGWTLGLAEWHERRCRPPRA